MSAVAKDIGYDIAKKPIIIAGTVASVVLVGYGIYYFFPDTAIGQLLGLGVDAVSYAVEGANWWIENVTIPAWEWVLNPDSYRDIGNFIVDDVGGFIVDDVGGAFEDAGNAVGDFFEDDVGGFFEDDVGGAFEDAGDAIEDFFKF